MICNITMLFVGVVPYMVASVWLVSNTFLYTTEADSPDDKEVLVSATKSRASVLEIYFDYYILCSIYEVVYYLTVSFFVSCIVGKIV